jgi:hypothetical protein
MTHWTASAVAILLASSPDVASAHVSCDTIPHGPARTDCYLALSQFYRGQSDLAAAAARAPFNQTPRGIGQLLVHTRLNIDCSVSNKAVLRGEAVSGTVLLVPARSPLWVTSRRAPPVPLSSTATPARFLHQ